MAAICNPQVRSFTFHMLSRAKTLDHCPIGPRPPMFSGCRLAPFCPDCLPPRRTFVPSSLASTLMDAAALLARVEAALANAAAVATLCHYMPLSACPLPSQVGPKFHVFCPPTVPALPPLNAYVSVHQPSLPPLNTHVSFTPWPRPSRAQMPVQFPRCSNPAALDVMQRCLDRDPRTRIGMQVGRCAWRHGWQVCI